MDRYGFRSSREAKDVHVALHATRFDGDVWHPEPPSSSFGHSERSSRAWAPNATDCSRFFHKKGRTVEFVRKGLGEPTSFIIDGQRARGPRASCQIKSVRARGDVLDLRLGCDTAVISDSHTVSVRFLDQDTIHRFDPSFPEIESRFERCKF